MRLLLTQRTWGLRGGRGASRTSTSSGKARVERSRTAPAGATARWPALKVFFTIGYTANAIVHHGVLDHGVNLIGKPLSASALAAKVGRIGF